MQSIDRVALHVSPHPDDEILGAGATLVLLRQHGWRILALTCTLGREADHDRRRAELLEATARVDFEPQVLEPLARLSSSDDLAAGRSHVAEAVASTVESTGASLVVSPHPHDGHHAHEAVGAAVAEALLGMTTQAPTWWQWGLWADLPKPTLYVPFSDETLSRVKHSVAAYEGENARNSFDELYPARATAARVLGSERVFGFGSASASDMPYADLLTELQIVESRLMPCAPRVMDPQHPLQ